LRAETCGYQAINPRYRRDFSGAAFAGVCSPGARPPFFDAFQTLGDGVKTIREFETRGDKGGRASSARALRTAAQYPCRTSASWLLRPLSRRSMGRMPRTRFFTAFSACFTSWSRAARSCWVADSKLRGAGLPPTGSCASPRALRGPRHGAAHQGSG
jgi:hypothetical protein